MSLHEVNQALMYSVHISMAFTDLNYEIHIHKLLSLFEIILIKSQNTIMPDNNLLFITLIYQP